MNANKANKVVSSEVRRLHFSALAIGLWLIIAPFVLGYNSTLVTTNEIVTAMITLALSGLHFYQPRTTWNSWTLGGVGIWLMLSPFIFGYGNHVSAYWNELGMGILLIILAFAVVGNSIRGHSHLAH